jgi:hypothetical protein
MSHERQIRIHNDSVLSADSDRNGGEVSGW